MLQRSLIHRSVAAATAAMTVVESGEAILRWDPTTHVAVLSLDRQARKNAIGTQLLSEVQSAIRICGGSRPDVTVRCLVLESSVKGVFCAGADLKERREMSVDTARAFVESLRRTFSDLEDLEIPTISVIEGKALGGGLELALSTDIRIAGAGAAFGFPETGLAIIPGAGGTVRAPALIGVSRALELILSAEQIGALQAKEMGLVNRVVPAGSATDAALEMAHRIARNGPIGVRAAKRSVRTAYGKPRDAAMACEQRCYEEVLATEDRIEGLKAFAEKRTPTYRGV